MKPIQVVRESYSLGDLIQGGDELQGQIFQALADKANELIAQRGWDKDKTRVAYQMRFGVWVSPPRINKGIGESKDKICG